MCNRLQGGRERDERYEWTLSSIPHRGFRSRKSFQHNVAVVGVLALALFGLAFESTMNWVLRRFFPWYRRDDGETG